MLLIICGVIAWQTTADTRPSNVSGTLLQVFLYHVSWLMFLFLPLVIWGFKHKQVSLGFTIVGVLGLILGIYARFVEPNLLIVKESHIKTGYKLKIALISDMHYGLYSTTGQMQRLVNKLNSLEVDAIVVAGDWTYEPPKKFSLIQQLAPFKQLQHPVYSVIGNHDEQMPGPDITQELEVALIANGVRPIEGQSIDLGKVRLAGIADLLPANTRHERLQALKIQDKPLLLLTHNPNSLLVLPKLTQPFVMLAGHTHGGQINLPILTQKVLLLSTRKGYKRGLYALEQNNKIFVTSGIGMVGLPLRFAMPPTIDVLQFK
ncbi:MAG: metallophosphoesterase [Moraxellaceae bacterium]|nr:metallophosphoesterase [Moraxellaceae bacterium]